MVVSIWFFKSHLAASGEKIQNQRYTVVRKNLTSNLSLSGTIEAEAKATLQFQTSGRLAWVGVKEGDLVQPWQAIASLDQRELKQNLQKKLYDYLNTRWDYEQFKEDNKKQETAQRNTYLTDKLTRIAEQSQFGLDKSVIDVELSQLAVELSTLVTPIAGIMTKIDQPIAGVNITPATARFEVVNPDTLFLKVIVDQQDIIKLKEGLRAQIVFDAFPSETYAGSIYYLSFTPAEGEDSAYLVKISLPQKAVNQVRLGMAAEAILNVGQVNQALVVPFLAIVQEGNKNYVNVLTPNNQVKKRTVVVGLENDNYVQIKKGLTEGEVVVY